MAEDGTGGVAYLKRVGGVPHVFVARYLGNSVGAARTYFATLWHLLRPALAGRDAVDPRIWNT